MDEKTPLKSGIPGFILKKAKDQYLVLKVLRGLRNRAASKNNFKKNFFTFRKPSQISTESNAVKQDIESCPQSHAQVQSADEDEENQKTSLLHAWQPGVQGDVDKKVSPGLPFFIILHYSAFKTAWDWFTLILVLYTAVFTPFMAAFSSRSSNRTSLRCLDSFLVPPPHSNVTFNLTSDFSESPVSSHSLVLSPAFIYNASNSHDPLTIHYNATPFFDLSESLKNELKFLKILNTIEVFVDIIFVTDILINFRTTYIDDGELVTEPRKIALNYIKSWFIIDAVAAIPFDWLLYRTGGGDTLPQGLTGILKTARLLRLLRVARKIDQYSEYGAAVLLLLMATFTLIAHWLACLFYAITTFERAKILQAPISWLDALAKQRGLKCQQELDTKSLYITALYFTFTILTSVGFGNIAPVTNYEKVFTIFVMLLGSLMSAAIFGNVSSIMLRLYRGTERYHEMVNSIREFINFYFFPKPLANRLLESYQNSRAFINGLETDSVFTSFPECLQSEICFHLHKELLNNFSLFSAVSPACLRLFSMKLKTMHVMPTETILHPGDLLDSALFITKGMLEVVNEDLVVAILGKGDSFGSGLREEREAAEKGQGSMKSAYCIKAMSNATIHKISLSDLRSVIASHPDFEQTFSQHFSVTFDLNTYEQALSQTQESVRFVKYRRKERHDFSYSNDTYQESRSSRNTLQSLENLPLHKPLPSEDSLEGRKEMERINEMMERRKEIMERREVMEEYEDEYSEGVSKKEYLEMVKKRLSLIGRRLGAFENDLCSIVDSINKYLEIGADKHPADEKM